MHRADRLIKIIDEVIPEPKLGLEIGVREAVVSVRLLERYRKLFLYLIDPYTPYKDHKNFYGKEAQHKFKKTAFRNLKDKFDNWTFVLDYSYRSSERIPNLLDFIFIDGSHNTNAVMVDLLLYAPKVRKGGLISGHDFHLTRVRDAVEVYADLYNYRIKTLGNIWYFEQ